MEQQQPNLLYLLDSSIRFATHHPYAAVGILGAAVGSAVTYAVLTSEPARPNGVFTPKVYDLILPRDDVKKLLQEPETELRWETPEMTVVISMEEPIPLKQLPVINVDSAE